MTTQMRSPADKKPKQRSGCLKGCLIALLVTLVLVVGCGGGTYLLGRNYIERQLPVWEDRYPVLGLLMELSGMGKQFQAFGNEMQHGGGWQAGVNDKAILPADIPMFPDPLVETYSLSEAQGIGYQRLLDSPAEVLQYLLEAMPQNGWVLDAEQETPGSYHLYWRQNERTCQTEVVESQDGTEIWLRYTN